MTTTLCPTCGRRPSEHPDYWDVQPSSLRRHHEFAYQQRWTEEDCERLADEDATRYALKECAR